MSMKKFPRNLWNRKNNVIDFLILVISAFLFWLVFKHWDCLKAFLIRLFQ